MMLLIGYNGPTVVLTVFSVS